MTTADTALKAEDKAQAPKDASPKGKVPSPAPKEPSPKQETYSQQEVDRLLQHERMEAGRERKVIELERDHFKAQAQSIEGKLTDNAEELAELQKQIEKLSSNDPELMNLSKEKKELLEERRKLNTRKRDEEAKFETNASRVKKAEAFELEVVMQTVTEEFEDGDFNKLKSLCETLEVTTEEKVRAVAETLFGTKVQEPEPKKPFVGRQAGGAGFVRDPNNPTETLKHAFRTLKQRT